ncbi:ABC transporter substrate-binding protein [Thiocystis violacea]|uniref:ABC transporter substrate-binding protein n=1 Tax=Thiocystis violacea TaxID=13725 RepID=UPI0019041F03|nr:ABC transporter substrate-binding protein [Thiocystis violacea]MBK1720395.1 ABC transporter substrate-binding protein [Thiocystis violacea]
MIPSHPSERRGRGRTFLVLALLCLGVGPASGDASRPTVMSTDFCSDLLLLNIAAPEQILSVSRRSRDPRVSPVADLARPYPSNRGGVEDVLHFKPDIALVYQGWTGRRHAERLAGRGTQIIALPYPKRWSDGLRTTREIAARIGRGEAVEAKVAVAERRLRALAQRSRPYRLLYLRPNGGTAGEGTYIDDLFRLLGLRNLAAEHGQSGWGRFPLETLVSAPPDVFLLGYFDQTQSPARSAYGRHPRLRAMLERTPVIGLPGNAWGCGGLELIDAAERIAEQLDALSPDLAPSP